MSEPMSEDRFQCLRKVSSLCEMDPVKAFQEGSVALAERDKAMIIAAYTLGEALDEIERLQAENKQLRKRIANQRRELKRLNIQDAMYWRGFDAAYYSKLSRNKEAQGDE